jgi:bifunctional DNase/RNase
MPFLAVGFIISSKSFLQSKPDASEFLYYYISMLVDSLEVKIRAVLPSPEGCAVFLGADRSDSKKVFVIYVDPTIGQQLLIAMNPVPKDRPLTHDLMANVFGGFGIRLERMIILDALGGTFYARMMLKMENELGLKMLEADSRPSDAMILALNAKKPITVSLSLWNKVEDATSLMNKLKARGN